MAKIIIENNDNNSIPVRYTYDNIPIEIVKNIKNNLDSDKRKYFNLNS